MNKKQACILGCGVMGSGIAALFCLSEKFERVQLWGRSQASLINSQNLIIKSIKKYARREAIEEAEVEKIISKLNLETSLERLTDNNIYIEAITEDVLAKKSIFFELNSIISEDAIVASNTSSLSITEIALSVNNPQNFIGIHFFNPTAVMKLVEVIKGVSTSDNTLNSVVELVKSLGKEPVVVNESPGFIVNRMLIPMINESINILAEQVATAEDIDKAMMLGANHPIGPLALADLIGNDVCLSIMETLHDETGDPKYRAHPLLRKYVRAGYLGRKTKIGFHQYK